MDKRHAVVIALGLVLASCGQQAAPGTSNTPYAQRPELQDAGSQAILQRYGDDPGLAAALREAYNEAPRSLSLPDVPAITAPAITAQNLTSDRLAYVKAVGWGSVNQYNGQYAAYALAGGPYPGLDWSRDGCSAPDGLGLGYTGDFRPACNVHDFGYRNLKVFERTDANRRATDEAFYSNMKVICGAKPWYKEPPCFAAAYAYYQGVRISGASSFE